MSLVELRSGSSDVDVLLCLVLLLLVELLVHLDGLGHQPHEVPVPEVETRVVQHPGLAVVATATVNIAVVPANMDFTLK